MKKNKGFTLIELLAVIVILAIIALIATPIILGVIEDARKSSAESSALGYIDAVEKHYAIKMLDSEAEGSTLTINGTTTVADLKTAGVKVKGTEPESGSVVVNEDGVISTGTCLIIKLGGTSYKVDYDGQKATATANGTCDATTTP